MRLAVFATAAAALAFAASAWSAVPNFILVSGPGVPRPVLLDDFEEIFALHQAVLAAPSVEADLTRRPRLDLAEFWWPSNMRPTDPAEASSHSSFYPAFGERKAVVVTALEGTSLTREATPKVLEILTRHGVPVEDHDLSHAEVAPALASDFSITASRGLPAKCASGVVSRRVADLLTAFNGGQGDAFARGFDTKGRFQAYNGRRVQYYGSTPGSIKKVIAVRHAVGDAWTALRLQPPSGGTVVPKGEAIYALWLRVTADGRQFEQGVKLIVGCATGKIRVWLGPAWPRV